MFISPNTIEKIMVSTDDNLEKKTISFYTELKSNIIFRMFIFIRLLSLNCNLIKMLQKSLKV